MMSMDDEVCAHDTRVRQKERFSERVMGLETQIRPV